VSVKLYDKLDLVTFKALGGTAAGAGIYSGAESLNSLPMIMAAAFAPLLLSSLGEAMKAGDVETARARGRKALQSMLLLLPLGGMLPGMSEELVRAMYGSAFLGVAPLFDIMIFGAIALFFVSVITSILVSAGKPGWTVRIMGPLVVAQLAGGLALIPRLGAIGAAWVTTVCAVVGCIVCAVLVYRLWRILPPIGTFVRAVGIGVACYLVAMAWPTPGPVVFLKFTLLSAAMIATFWWFGDLPGMTISGGRVALGWRSRADQR
jgi:O-antigen/teichoic acid export membrane protein